MITAKSCSRSRRMVRSFDVPIAGLRTSHGPGASGPAFRRSHGIRRMQHSPDQVAALAYIDAFLLGPQREQCVVHGLAGTGKTALLCEIAKRYPHAILCAPTNKAASNLTKKLGRPTNTIHSLIYYPNEVVDQDGKLVQKW